MNVESPSVKEEVKEEARNESQVKLEVAPATTAGKWYGIQIMGLGRLLKAGDPALKGLAAEAVKSESSTIYKYVTARSQTREKAAAQLSAVRKKFPEAFLVEVEGDVVKRCK